MSGKMNEEMGEHPDTRITLTLNVFGPDGGITATRLVKLTVAQIEDIVDHSTQLITLNREGEDGMCEDVMDELDAALTAASVMDEFAPTSPD